MQEFEAEVLHLVQAWGLKGINLDWEFGYGNNVSCWNQLWSRVSSHLSGYGKALAISVDDSAGRKFSLNETAWSYEWDWIYDLSFASILINMGPYPGSWSAGISYPASQYLQTYHCKGDP